MRFFDAHNHLQDDRFYGRQEEIVQDAMAAGVTAMVVNGCCEQDWPVVAELARRHPGIVIPAFGYHPWYLHERTNSWKHELVSWLDSTPGAVVGEIGLDRWILAQPPAIRTRYAHSLAGVELASMEVQEEAFAWQLNLAAERNLAASIHCLDAFGRLEELLRQRRRPARGFLLHSYGGSVEMVPSFAALGAYFSFPGYFAHERKGRRREAFRSVPLGRLLVESDAPDQLPPDAMQTHSLRAPDGTSINHPANLPAIQAYLSDFLGLSRQTLASTLEENFKRLFLETEH